MTRKIHHKYVPHNLPKEPSIIEKSLDKFGVVITALLFVSLVFVLAYVADATIAVVS